MTTCDYEDCDIVIKDIIGVRLGPFWFTVRYCEEHYQEFYNFLKVIEAKNISWRKGQ